MQRDLGYVADIVEAGRLIASFTSGMTWATFSGDVKTQDAVIRRLEIIGEASRRISDVFKRQHAEIEWSQIVGMRNRLIHEYGAVNLVLVWDVVENYVPALVSALALLLDAD
jgi:uncharacterized protein with HEPN domain